MSQALSYTFVSPSLFRSFEVFRKLNLRTYRETADFVRQQANQFELHFKTYEERPRAWGKAVALRTRARRR